MQIFSNLTAKQIGLILVFVPILIELACVGVVVKELVEAGRNFKRVHHVKTTLLRVIDAQFLCLKSFFILSEPGRQNNELRHAQLRKVISVFDNDGWARITAESNPELQDILERSEELRKTNLRLSETMINDVSLSRRMGVSIKEQNTAIAAVAMESQKVAEDILRIETGFVKNEPGEIANLRFKFLAIIFLGFAINSVVSIALLTILVGRLKSKITYVIDRAQQLALGKPLAKGPTGRDELSEVDDVIYEAGNALEQFRWTQTAVLDNAADAICSLDEKMRFVTLGESSEKVFGHESEALVRKSVMTLVTPETAEFTRASLEKIHEGEREGKFENALRLTDGSIKDALWTVTWSAEKQCYFCVVSDVTEFRHVDRMKKRFMAMVSHDLRSPLTSIAIILTTMAAGKRGDLPEGAYKEIERANANSQRLLALVNDFLELEKLEAHKFAMDLGAVAASEVCNVARESLAGMAKGANVRISAPTGEALLFADERRIVQVLINLLSNAIKFSPANSTVRMAISIEGEQAIIKVIDEGPGIAQEEQQVIFDKFQQTRLKSQVNMKGTGLGLSIVKNIVEAHGGRVGVASTQQIGSTFWFSLPLFQDEEEALP